jgi:hypothetical protein
LIDKNREKCDAYCADGFDIVLNRDPDPFAITSAKIEVLKADAIVLDWPAILGEPRADAQAVLIFNTPTGFDALAKGTYTIQLVIFEGTRRETLASGSWKVY